MIEEDSLLGSEDVEKLSAIVISSVFNSSCEGICIKGCQGCHSATRAGHMLPIADCT